MSVSPKKTNLLFSVAVLISFSLTAAAQDSSYSADSLIATFKNGSQSPLKGTEIRLSDLVVEVRKSSVIFRSSERDRVICELVSPIANLGQVPFGRPLTVVGKVRGRGLLGNVTLDQCSFAQPAAVAGNEKIAVDTPQQVAELPMQPTELPAPLPLETAAVLAQAPVSAAVPATMKSPALVQPATTAAAASPVAIVADNRLGAVNPAPQGVEQPQAISQCAEPPTGIPYGSHLLVALFAGIGTLTLSKLRLTASSSRIRTSPGASSDDVRRAALEALLSKQKK